MEPRGRLCHRVPDGLLYGLFSARAHDTHERERERDPRPAARGHARHAHRHPHGQSPQPSAQRYTHPEQSPHMPRARPRTAPLRGACQQQHVRTSAVQGPVRARGGLVDEGRWVLGGCRPWPHARTAPPHRLLGCGCAGERGGGWRRAALAAVAVPLEVEEELEYAALEAALEAALVARLPLAVDYLLRGSAERVRVRVRARVALGLG